MLVFSESKALGVALARGAAEVVAKAGRKIALAHLGTEDDSSGSDAVARALAKEVEARGAKMILVPGTRRGKEVGAYLAGLLGCGIVGEVSGIAYEPSGFVFDRGLFGGRFLARIRGLSARGVVLVQPHSLAQLGPAPTEIIVLSAAGLGSRARRTGVRAKAAATANIEEAKVIVSGGRGIKKKEDFAVLEALAKATGGMVGCSRPIAQDLRWLSADHWVGLSGHKVRPELYIACGISGQVQHIAGIGDAKVVVAINNDASAPIFQEADYGIVGDLYQILPAITRRVKK